MAESKMVDDFDGTPAIELSDSDAVLEKKIMNASDLDMDTKLAILRRIEDARHNSSIVEVDSKKPYDYGLPGTIYTGSPTINFPKITGSYTPTIMTNCSSNDFKSSALSGNISLYSAKSDIN